MSTTSLQHLTELQKAAFLAGLRGVLQKQAFQDGFQEACEDEGIPVEEALDAALKLFAHAPPLRATEVLRVERVEVIEPREMVFVRQHSQLAPPMERKHVA